MHCLFLFAFNASLLNCLSLLTPHLRARPSGCSLNCFFPGGLGAKGHGPAGAACRRAGVGFVLVGLRGFREGEAFSYLWCPWILPPAPPGLGAGFVFFAFWLGLCLGGFPLLLFPFLSLRSVRLHSFVRGAG